MIFAASVLRVKIFSAKILTRSSEEPKE